MPRVRHHHIVLAAFLLLFGLAPGAIAQEEPAAPEAEAEAEAAVEGSPEETAEADEVVVTVETRKVKSFTFVDRVKQGGWTMLFLGMLSVMSATFAIERLVHLRKDAILPEGLSRRARELWNEGKFDEVRSLCRSTPSTLSTIIDGLVEYRHCPYVELSEMAGDMGAREIRGHLQKAYPLAVSGTLAPLLGLFGTVIGMIEAFEIVAIAGSLGDASLLAGSISKALITTAGGLLVAIPSLGLYHLIRTRINRYAMGLEEQVNQLLSTWFLKKPAQEASS